MTEPDRLVLVTLSLPGRHDRQHLSVRTRLAGPTLEQTLRKLVRMRWVAGDDGGYRLTSAGLHAAKTLREAR